MHRAYESLCKRLEATPRYAEKDFVLFFLRCLDPMSADSLRRTAPQQCHEKACGQTMIIDPWGTVLARLDMEPGVITAEIDMENPRATRDSMGIFANRRTDLYDTLWIK